ncbi:hypothetical protein BC941DRAFT_413566 [Chlamydoabsidia padenii]|nr:hypothetical protein BC941DRAFT_413566 [Chlamydoabsidia padenii]
MVFESLKKRCGSLFSARNLALMSDFILCIISIGLIALELLFLPQWVSSGVTMIDFYIYIAITGIIIILTVIEIFFIKKRSLKGIHRLFLALSGVCSAQFIVGLVHIGLLYSRYQKKLLEKCIQRIPPDGFWWSFGYESMDELNKAYQTCEHNWIRFSLLRLLSCLVFGLLACTCLFFIQKYYYRLKSNAQSDLNKLVHSSWDDPITSPVENNNTTFDMEKNTFNPSPPPPEPIFYPSPTLTLTPEEMEANESIAFEKHGQRQKLYEEIAKRRRLESKKPPNSNRSSVRYSQLVSTDESSSVLAHDTRWGSLIFDGDRIRLEETPSDHLRLDGLDDFDQAKSRRSSKRHRKFSVSCPRQQPVYPQDEAIGPLETSRQQQDGNDESAPLNPFDNYPI